MAKNDERIKQAIKELINTYYFIMISKKKLIKKTENLKEKNCV